MPETEAEAVARIVEDTDAILPTDLRAEGTDLLAWVLPDGRRVEITDLEKHNPWPRRKTGRVAFHRAASFAQYVTDHAVDGTALYADVEKAAVTAVLDGHEPDVVGDEDGSRPGNAGWGQHRAVLGLRFTPAWKRWTAQSGVLVDQETFGQFLEDGVDDILDPSAADLIELSRTFEATKGVSFKGSHRPVSGQRVLRYEETVEGRAGNGGQIKVPETFTLALAPWEGGAPYKIAAKFRYRITSGGLRLGYELDRPEKVLDAAFTEVLAAIETGTGRTVLHGTPAG